MEINYFLLFLFSSDWVKSSSPMLKSNNRLLLHIIIFLMIVHKICTDDQQQTSVSSPFSYSVLPSEWQPVLKTKNNTNRDWKLSANVHASSLHQFSSAPTMSHESLQDTEPSLRLSHPTHHYSQNYHQQRRYDILLPPTISTSSATARYEHASDVDGYYYPSYNLPNKPGTGTLPSVYGPSIPTPFPEQSVTIELGFDRLILRCVVQEPLEHIVWTRYPCPNDYLFGANGVPVADGSVVQNADLYDVRIVGENGEIASELLLKSPLEATTSGLYLCEAWPHYQKPSDLYGHYQPPMYGSVSDAFIIGGSELLDQCYNTRPPFINRPSNSNRKQYEEENGSNNNKKLPQQNKNQSNKKPNQNVAADPIRKPRNITSYFATDKEKIFPDFDRKQNTILYEQPRYNFKFLNYTNINNASLADVFVPNIERNNILLNKIIKIKSQLITNKTDINSIRPKQVMVGSSLI